MFAFDICVCSCLLCPYHTLSSLLACLLLLMGGALRAVHLVCPGRPVCSMYSGWWGAHPVNVYPVGTIYALHALTVSVLRFARRMII